jgi:putative membrane protein
MPPEGIATMGLSDYRLRPHAPRARRGGVLLHAESTDGNGLTRLAARLLRIGIRRNEWEKKHVKNFLVSIFATAAIYCVLSLPALAQKTNDQNQSQTRSSTNTRATDNSFLEKAIQANAAEIELGKMAESKSQNPRVKDFASTLVKDHTDALNRLEQLKPGTESQSSSAIPLSKQQQQLKDRLSKLSGDAFDREYVNAMVTEHQKNIREFEREAGSQSSGVRQKPQPEKGNQPAGTDEQSTVRELIPTLKMHLQEAQSLQKELARGTSQR